MVGTNFVVCGCRIGSCTHVWVDGRWRSWRPIAIRHRQSTGYMYMFAGWPWPAPWSCPDDAGNSFRVKLHFGERTTTPAAAQTAPSFASLLLLPTISSVSTIPPAPLHPSLRPQDLHDIDTIAANSCLVGTDHDTLQSHYITDTDYIHVLWLTRTTTEY